MASETLDDEENVRHDYCLFVMKLHWNDANPPTQIVLYKSEAPLPEPTAEAPLLYDETALRWQDKMIAVYRVNGKNLE